MNVQITLLTGRERNRYNRYMADGYYGEEDIDDKELDLSFLDED